jgi:nucleoside-diphosphate-sugar epimerase
MARLLGLLDRRIPLPLGRIEARRSHLFVGNLVDLLVQCVTHPGASRRIFVVDDGEPIDTRDLIRELARLSGKRAMLLPVPIGMLQAAGRVGDFLQRVIGRTPTLSDTVEKLLGSLIVDSRGVQAALSWNPPVARAEGFRSTVQPEPTPPTPA